MCVLLYDAVDLLSSDTHILRNGIFLHQLTTLKRAVAF